MFYLVHSDRFPVQFYHVHDFDGIVGVLLTHELDKPVALMILCDTIFGHVHIHDRTSLDEQLP